MRLMDKITVPIEIKDISELKKLLQQAGEQVEQLERTLIQINEFSNALKV